ncbi:hypothetical protein, partial [Salmonella enterica]|uniref:hypothetical protein n=1 Tax=Salmonella enterica TaxID=28901 RepID=UPI0022B6EE6E|nr:hypothetical protein [Salmonella enterica]
SSLKERAEGQTPELAKLAVAPKVGLGDVEAYKLGLETEQNKKSNNVLVQNVSTLEYIAKFAEAVFAGKIKPSKTVQPNKKLKR